MYLWNREFRIIGKEVTSYFSNQGFDSQGGVLGEKWPALSPAYKKYKAKKYGSVIPLVRTKAMKRGFVYDSDAESVTITNSAPYFAYHQSNEPRTKLPRRVMMKATPAVKTLVSGIIQDGLTNKIRSAGLK